MTLRERAAIGALVFFLLLLLGLQTAHAGELVTSIGLSRATGSDETPRFLGLAVRGASSPLLKVELGVSWQHQSYSNGDLTVHSVPVTGSLWITPIPTFYVGGGAGVYYDQLSYSGALGVPKASNHAWGTHLGSGMSLPLSPMTSLDLQGRYVFLGEQRSALAGGTFNPSMWMASVGLAIKY